MRQLPEIVTQKLINFRVTMPGNRSISGYRYPEIDQLSGNDTRQLANQPKMKNNPWVTIFGGCKYSGIVTQKLINLRVTIPGILSITEHCYPVVEFREKTTKISNLK
jgi:hypothetical protein